MSGIWLESGLHLNVTYGGAMKIAQEIEKGGHAELLGQRVKMLLPTRLSSQRANLQRQIKAPRVLRPQFQESDPAYYPPIVNWHRVKKAACPVSGYNPW